MLQKHGYPGGVVRRFPAMWNSMHRQQVPIIGTYSVCLRGIPVFADKLRLNRDGKAQLNKRLIICSYDIA
jgi:hypothetical protein